MAVINVLKVLFPFYHTVSDKELIHIKNLYRVRTTSEFKRDLDFFLRHYHPLDINDLLNSYKNNDPIKGRKFVLSFDDGLSQVYDIIVPILKEKGMNAIFFINPSFVGNKDLFFRYKASILIETLKKSIGTKVIDEFGKLIDRKSCSIKDITGHILSIDYASRLKLDEFAVKLEVDFARFLEEEKPYLTEIQIQSIIKDGFFIGAHSLDHPYYDKISIEEQLHQTVESTVILQKQYSLNYRLFSFPFTDSHISRPFFEEIYKKDNRKVDLSFGMSGIKKDPCLSNIQRIPLENYSMPASWSVFIQYIYWVLKIPFGKNKIQRY
jgi:peptidoglycan/xylan/chitin deacetylase (PgdA/CDA1 family)